MSHKVRIVISLCLNLALGIYFLCSLQLPHHDIGPEQKKAVSSQAGIATTQKTKQPPAISNVIENERDWHSLESTDYREFIRNLRAIHCPEATIQDIILAEIDELYGPKLANLTASRPRNTDEIEVKGRIPAEEPLKAERALLIESLLGVKEQALRAKYNWHDATIQPRFAFLSAETREKLISLEEKYGVFSQNAVFEHGRYYVLDEDEISEVHVEMAGFMTEAEIAEYDLRASKYSWYMSQDFAGINVTEPEFRSIFPVYRAWYQARSNLSDLWATLTEEEKTARRADIKQAESRLATLMSQPRYEEFRLWRDMSYESLFTAGTYLGYNPKVAKDVIKMRADVLKTVEAVRKDGDLQEDGRAIKLKEIRRITEKEIQRLIGERGLNYYLMSGNGGRWVDDIAPDGIKR